MLGLSGLSRPQRLILGVVVLLVVNIIWVASSELTKYIYKQAHYDKPFFTTYAKTAMFMVYLSGFLFWKPWRQQCRRTTKSAQRFDSIEDCPIDTDKLLGDPIFVPIKFDDKSSGAESDESSNDSKNKSTVRFSNLSEVRQLSDIYAEEAVIARLSYNASVRAEEARLRALSKLSLKQVAKIAFIFCILWFFGNFCYQKALDDTEASIVNVLSSTSSLFTLVGAAVYPSNSADRFTLSKLAAVMFSICGITLVSITDSKFEEGIPAGSLWALGGSLLYAAYLVVLKRKADHEDKLDLPMFFGFVGFFNTLFLWPGFFLLHYSKQEIFEWPTDHQWMFIAINGMIGTVLSEMLWLWGCFLTSSLIGTLALSLTIPLSMLADVIIKGVPYTWMFYVGSLPVFMSFFAVTLLAHYENWDPVMIGIRKILHCICRQRQLLPSSHYAVLNTEMRELDREQTESLINAGDMAPKSES